MSTCGQCGNPAAFMVSLCDDCINERAERMQASVRGFPGSGMQPPTASADPMRPAFDAESSGYLDRPMSEGGIQPDPPANPAAIAFYLLCAIVGLVLVITLFGGAILLIGVGPIALLIILAAAMKIIRQR